MLKRVRWEWYKGGEWRWALMAEEADRAGLHQWLLKKGWRRWSVGGWEREVHINGGRASLIYLHLIERPPPSFPIIIYISITALANFGTILLNRPIEFVCLVVMMRPGRDLKLLKNYTLFNLDVYTDCVWPGISSWANLGHPMRHSTRDTDQMSYCSYY